MKAFSQQVRVPEPGLEPSTGPRVQGILFAVFKVFPVMNMYSFITTEKNSIKAEKVAFSPLHFLQLAFSREGSLYVAGGGIQDTWCMPSGGAGCSFVVFIKLHSVENSAHEVPEPPGTVLAFPAGGARWGRSSCAPGG